jgi:ubiquitin carboxyl-terminal hydrolase L5
MIPNACATQALLSVLLNAEGASGLELGSTLGDFKAFTGDFSPELRGMAIGNSDSIREAHNSFARAEPFMMEESAKGGKSEDVFHFIAYLPFGGKVGI